MAGKSGAITAPKVNKAQEIARQYQSSDIPYDEELAYQIVEMIADGISLKRICELDGMPRKASFYRWMDSKQDLRDKYARAKDDAADALADDIEDIANAVLKGVYDPAAARVAVDAKKWIASKLKPKKYGDKLDLTSDGKALPQPLLGGVTIEPTKSIE